MGDLLEGSGANEYIENKVNVIRRYMYSMAESNLEFVFNRPLADDELADLQIKLRSFTPSKNQVFRETTKRVGEKLRIDDPENETYEMRLIADFGMVSLAESRLHQLFTPQDLYSSGEYVSLRKKMLEEYKELEQMLIDSGKGEVELSHEDGIWVIGNRELSNVPVRNTTVRAAADPHKEEVEEGGESQKGRTKTNLAAIGIILIVLIGVVLLSQRAKSSG